jgi:hypothetical protein
MKKPDPKQDSAANAGLQPAAKPALPATSTPRQMATAKPASPTIKPAITTPNPPTRPAAPPVGGRTAATNPVLAAKLAPAGASARGNAKPAAAPPGKPVNGTPLEMVNYLGGQIQVLATRLESLREQGAGQTTEFRQLEQMLAVVQDKLVLAQGRIERNL